MLVLIYYVVGETHSHFPEYILVKLYRVLIQFRRNSDGDIIPGPEQGFDIVGGYFSADLKSFLSHSLNMHFPITRPARAFMKIKVMLLS
jgi:hypothetical protein